MGSSRRGRPSTTDDVDSRIYGIVWVGLVAASVGAVIGALMMSSPDGSALVGGATIALSTAMGALVYLVSKVLDRQ